MDNYDGYGYGVNYGEEYIDGFSEGEDAVGGGGSSSTASVGGGSASAGSGSVSVGGSSVSGGGGSVSVSGSSGVGGGSASAGAGAGAGTGQRVDGEDADYTDFDGFKEESITDLTDSDLDKVYSDYKDYYSEVLPAETDNYQVALRARHNHKDLQSSTA